METLIQLFRSSELCPARHPRPGRPAEQALLSRGERKHPLPPETRQASRAAGSPGAAGTARQPPGQGSGASATRGRAGPGLLSHLPAAAAPRCLCPGERRFLPHGGRALPALSPRTERPLASRSPRRPARRLHLQPHPLSHPPREAPPSPPLTPQFSDRPWAGTAPARRPLPAPTSSSPGEPPSYAALSSSGRGTIAAAALRRSAAELMAAAAPPLTAAPPLGLARRLPSQSCPRPRRLSAPPLRAPPLRAPRSAPPPPQRSPSSLSAFPA